MTVKIFDTHAHYDQSAFDGDRDFLLSQMPKEGVERIVNIACSMESSRRIVEMVGQYDFLYGTVGVHPDDIMHMGENDLDELGTLARRDKIVAIGEIGLDYHYEGADRELQQKWMRLQMELAVEKGLPVVIHSRDAAKDTFDLISSFGRTQAGGVIHCFSYGDQMAMEYVMLGYYIGVGGVVTFKNARKLKEVVEAVPLDRIVLETDAPYLAPVPFRGKRNCSTYLKYVAEEIARLKGEELQEVYETTFENAVRLYRMNR